MSSEQNYLDINRASWNKRTDIHLTSDFYNMDGFLAGKSSLNDIELQLLGNISGKSILHLQCHFGQDSISLSRLGAKVTGVDISDRAIDAARTIAMQTKSDANFICSDIYDLPNHLEGQFDMVFTSYGTIGWLPDLDKWAQVIAHYLRSGGTFLIAEFHPFVWMFDNDFEKISYNYFNAGAIVETESGTYADKQADITQEYVSWNHNLAEVVNSLIRHGLEINVLNEYDYSPYNCFNKTVEISPGKYQLAPFGNKMPMVYAIRATKK